MIFCVYDLQFLMRYQKRLVSYDDIDFDRDLNSSVWGKATIKQYLLRRIRKFLRHNYLRQRRSRSRIIWRNNMLVRDWCIDSSMYYAIDTVVSLQSSERRSITQISMLKNEHFNSVMFEIDLRIIFDSPICFRFENIFKLSELIVLWIMNVECSHSLNALECVTKDFHRDFQSRYTISRNVDRDLVFVFAVNNVILREFDTTHVFHMKRLYVSSEKSSA